MKQLVLVVDDEPKIVRLARDYLEQGGFGVISAADGRAALQAARRERPDLVVLDLGLPEMDGLEVCRALRREVGCGATFTIELPAAGAQELST